MGSFGRKFRLTPTEIVLLFVGAACIAIALAFASRPSDRAEFTPVPTCEVGDEDTCAEFGRRLATVDIETGAARYFLVGLVQDISDAESTFASVGVRLVPSGCLCCDPLQMAYNKAVLGWLRERRPGFVMPLAIH